MKQVNLKITEELLQALDAAAKDCGQTRNAYIEHCLWKVQAVKRAAAKLGIEKRDRRKPGGQPKQESGKKR